jgi:hypothetical protein
MASLIFNEESLINNNLFRFEERLHSQVSKFVGEGAVLTTYYQLKDNATTVDRGIKDIEQLFGHKSPLRFNAIKNFPIYKLEPVNPTNTDELGVEDINVEGDFIILPSTLVPNPNDFFIINHLKMDAIFQVIDVQYDSMKTEGYYKIRYRLHSTSKETLQWLEKQTLENYNTELDAIGTNVNPIIQEDDFIRRRQIQQMVNTMINSYRALFYNEKHNCFLFNNSDGNRWFDHCGNEFMAKNSLMNPSNSNKVIILHDKLRDQNTPMYYNNSIYNWIELGSPIKMLQKFNFCLIHAEQYIQSSFARWSEGDIYIIRPLNIQDLNKDNREYSYFDEIQMQSLEDKNKVPINIYEKLIHDYVHKGQSLSIKDVSLDIADTLISSIKHIDIFLYTPIIIYIIRKILKMN